MVSGLMLERCFFVEDMGAASSTRPQRSGISQGCTLSPLLFIMLMTEMMKDAVSLLSPPAKASYDQGELADLAFADDTLLLGTSTAHVSEFLAAVERAGRQYGLEVHYGKLQLIQVGRKRDVQAPNGQTVEAGAEIMYLGTVITETGNVRYELNRRIGSAKGDFNSFCKVTPSSGCFNSCFNCFSSCIHC